MGKGKLDSFVTTRPLEVMGNLAFNMFRASPSLLQSSHSSVDSQRTELIDIAKILTFNFP